jgi:uncharacterized FlaG/YvyC family protein
MATTTEQLKDDEAAFASAFNEDQAPAAQMSEDEEFGLAEPAAEEPAAEAKDGAPEMESEDAGNANDGEAPAVAIVIDGGELEEAADQANAKDSAEAAADAGQMGDTVAMAEEGAEDTAAMAKEIQRLKSWEGRLKAMEAKLKAAGADTEEEQTEAVAEAIEKSADATDTPADEEKVEQIAEQVEDGQISVTQAMKQLADDFGDEFVKMIEAIATAKAREAGSQVVGELKGTVDEIIGDIVDTKAKAHFEKIADAHPDFNEIGESEEFKAFIDAMPEEGKGAALDTIANGSAKSIIKLLNDFKAVNKSGGDAAPELTEAKESILDEVSEDQMDAAEGVRSSGMKLPEQPAKSDDYESAWSEF